MDALPQPAPESSDTLLEQQRQLIRGERKAQMFPGGEGELPLPLTMARTVTENGDVFHHPPKVSADMVRKASASGHENRLLGLGPVTKHEAVARAAKGEAPVIVTERTPNGVEVRGAAGTAVTAPRQVAALRRFKSPGNFVQVEDPQSAIMARVFGSLVPNS